MTVKRFIPTVICLFFCVALSGCSGATIYSDYREVADLEIIRTIGIDKSESGVIIIASTGTELSSQSPKMFRAEGASITDALRNIQTTPMGQSLYFAHTEHLLIGEEAAKDGIASYLDFVERISEMRLDTNMFVVRNGTAEEMMTNCSGKGSSASDMLSFLETNIKNVGDGYVYTCEDIAAGLASKGTALIMAVKTADTNVIGDESGEKIVLSSGFGVIKDGKLVDFLTNDETRGAALLMEKVSFDNAPIDMDGVIVSLGLNGESVQIFPIFSGNKLDSVEIVIVVESNIEEVSGDIYVSDPAVRRTLSQKLAELEVQRVASAIEHAQNIDLDFLSLGSAVERKAAAQYRSMTPSWADVFSDITFNIKVKSIVRRSYDIENPFNVSGKEDEKFWIPTIE